MNTFITYNQFIKQQYHERCDSAKVAALYKKAGGFKVFKANYIKCNGFGEYLAFIQHSKLSTIQLYHLAKMFYVYGKRAPSTLPMVLSSVSRQYHLAIPDCYGILTKEYWLSRFDGPLLS